MDERQIADTLAELAGVVTAAREVPSQARLLAAVHAGLHPDAAEARDAIAVAEGERGGEVRCYLAIATHGFSGS